MRGFNQYQGAKQELEILSLDIVPSGEVKHTRNRDSQNGLLAMQETYRKGESGKAATLVFGCGIDEGLAERELAAGQVTVARSLEYRKVKSVLKEIQEYFSYSQFTEIYGENADNILRLVDNILDGMAKQEEEHIVKKSLSVLRKITADSSDTMIGAGILALLGTLSV